MLRILTQTNPILRSLCRPAMAVVVTLLLLIPGFAQPMRSRPVTLLSKGLNAIANQPFYNIAHMTNTREAVDWAINQGANGVEIDLQFDANGKPTEFKHGGSCDCSCLGTPPANHVCTPLLDSCDARSNPTQLLNHIAKTNLALVYIDSKVDINTHYNAGSEVIQLLERDLFGAEFQGIVIVAAPDNYYYLNTAASRMASSFYQDRIFFTLDMDRDRTAQETIDVLQLLPTRNLVYSTGISACVPPLPYISTYYDDIETAVKAQGNGKLKMTGIWTIDSEGNMGNYINTGAGAIVTNKPGVLKQVLINKNIPLARAHRAAV